MKGRIQRSGRREEARDFAQIEFEPPYVGCYEKSPLPTSGVTKSAAKCSCLT